MTPVDLMRAILTAPVDLLYFGGIGTYVKASSESHLAVGDKANDPVRIDGRELRCKVVGEGANLGFTQAGRIEYALGGGRIDTDAIDNSAGVDTSDHEVNIKILTGGAERSGKLAHADRDKLLASMTDEIAEHIRRALKYIPAERLILSSDCGMGREGMSRRHAFYKMVSMVRGTNIVRKELGLPEAECLAADPRYTLVPQAK